MDIEISGLLTQLDSLINNLAMQPNVDLNKLREIQNLRAQLDTKVTAYRQQLENMHNNFKNDMKHAIADVQNKLNRAVPQTPIFF